MENHTAAKRSIQTVWTPKSAQHNSIHRAAMILEPGQFELNDPFLFLAEDWFGHGTFDVHPHRGIETVTYVIEGKLKHYDNRFGEGELAPGDVQWMTAGRGVIHKEDPAPGDTVHSLQLWVNLPREHKLTEPRYQNLRAEDMPVRQVEGGTIRVFSGQSGPVSSTTQNYVPVTMVEIQLEAGVTVSQELPGDYEGFFYVLEGSGTFGSEDTAGNQGQGLRLSSSTQNSSGMSEVTIHAVTPLKVLLYAGRPLHEPVVAYGPFVMNTKEEIAQAFKDYQNGVFGR